ncbi:MULTISPECIES: helix-turn-helix transcriptional regulator [Streptomyces]|uniref:Transcription regulator PadR N-terminal domain-containing protein n=1 Tax=Streptomyces luteosporeus TaxID=173856 RepID=A0ABN3TYZ7_9ACTN
MPPVFAHGRLRLYLLGLLDEAPRHGYEVIRLLEERFQGLYAPSAGTVYPRLAKLEAEGLVTHATEGGRKVYSITDAGRAELAARRGELADLEAEIRDSLTALAADIREDVRGAAGALRHEMREAALRARTRSSGVSEDFFTEAKEELRRAKQEWKDQARRARSRTTGGVRDLERLLDRFRDEVRDAARDHGLTEPQLEEVRRLLKETATHVAETLRR